MRGLGWVSVLEWEQAASKPLGFRNWLLSQSLCTQTSILTALT